MLSWAIKLVVVWTTLGVVLLFAVSEPEQLSILLRRGGGDGDGAVVVDEAEGSGHRSLSLRAGLGGHFWVDAEVDGTTVHFVVDTGATTVVLSREDAERIGLVLDASDYTQVHRTAGGTVRSAPVTLGVIRIGPLAVRNVEASVNPKLSGISLLGMSFLSRLDGYEAQRDTLRLYW